MSFVFSILSGEWLLHHRPNSGGIVLVRALFVSLLCFSLAIGIYSYLDPRSQLVFSLPEYFKLVRDDLPWFGAIFGGAYAAFYSRFSSQWQYLAGLYNQLMAAEDARPRRNLKGEQRKRRMMWWHAFIADAQDVHLALKPTFAEAVLTLLEEPEIATLARGTTAKERKEFDMFRTELHKIVHSGESSPETEAGSGQATDSTRERVAAVDGAASERG